MNIFGNTKVKRINPGGILGAMGFLDETGSERETSLVASVAATATRSVAQAAPESISELATVIFGLGQEESKKQSNGEGKFSMQDSIDFQEERAKIERKKAFYQALKDDQDRTQRAKDKLLFEEELDDITTNLPTDQKNQLLHYQASYRDRSIYQRAELRKKLIEQRRKAEQQQKQASIPSPAKQPTALEGAFEGRSGSQGGGQANLSFQAAG